MDVKHALVLKQIKDLQEGDWIKCNYYSRPVCYKKREYEPANGTYFFFYGMDYDNCLDYLLIDGFKYLGRGKKKNKVLAFLSRNPYKWSDQMEEEYKKRRIRAIGY